MPPQVVPGGSLPHLVDLVSTTVPFLRALINSVVVAGLVGVGLAVAGSFIATLPLLVLFVFVGRRMVAGIMDGAFKG